MGLYLRDQHLKNLSFGEDNLRRLNEVFVDRFLDLNKKFAKEGEEFHLTYLIRFDNKGHRVFEFDELVRYFNQATNLERIFFTIESSLSLKSGRNAGTLVELRLDKLDANVCFLTVTSDDRDWVEATFNAISDQVIPCKNGYGWARTTLFQLSVQIAAVTLGFMVSYWITAKTIGAPSEPHFLISFFFWFLIISNLWIRLHPVLSAVINHYFPNIEFYRPKLKTLHWIMQLIIGSLTLTIGLYFTHELYEFLKLIVSGIYMG